MTIIDTQGRLFGRVNLFDAAIAMFAILVVPLAYGSYLLFRPSAPQIESVTQVNITREERRLAGGTTLSAKLKVHGTGFNPMLRATIGDTPALAFVFENPNSADVLVGTVPAGSHDLILYDGVQQVARAEAAVTITPAARTRLRAVGRFVAMAPEVAGELKDGLSFPAGDPAFTIETLRPLEPGRRAIALGDRRVELPVESVVERAAVLTLWCDPATPEQPCAIGGHTVSASPPLEVPLPGPSGPMWFHIEEVFPAAAASTAQATVLLASPGSELALVRPGDRDDLIDPRAARVISVGTAANNGDVRQLRVTLDLGVDAGRDGWLYRGRPIKPGETLVLNTDRYRVEGIVQQLQVSPSASAAQ